MTSNPKNDIIQRAERLLVALRRGDVAAGKELMGLLSQLEGIAETGRPDVQALVAGINLEYLNDAAKAYRLFTQSANADYPAGQRGLGHMLANGIGVEKDVRAAAQLFESAAQAGDAVAAFNFSMMLSKGLGVERDESRAESLLREAANLGLPAACGALADRLAKGGNVEEARRLYQHAAEGGVPKAMFTLASWCRDGVGGPIDFVQAVRWFLGLLDFGNGDGVHEAISLARSMPVEEIKQAARLAGRGADADALIRAAGR